MRLSSMIGSGAGLTPVKVDADYTAKANDLLLLNSSAGSFAVRLPTTGVETGSTVGFLDYSRTLNTHPVTVNGNSRMIEGNASELLDIRSVIVYYQYDKGTSSWSRRLVGSRDMIDYPKFKEDFENHSHGDEYAAKSHYHDDRYPLRNHKHDEEYISRTKNSGPATDNTISVGDSTHRFREIHATTFHGTAVKARYSSASGADLAEKYTVDPEVEILDGKVLSRSVNPEFMAEVYPGLTPKFRLLGPVSSNAGVILNEDLEGGVPIGRIGIVSVLVVGPAPYGSPLVVRDGVCERIADHEADSNYVFATSLEDSDAEHLRIIQAIM